MPKEKMKKEEKAKTKETKTGEIEVNLPKNPWFYTTLLFIALTVVSTYTKGFTTISGKITGNTVTGDLTDTGSLEMQGTETPDGQVTVIWLVDSECSTCYDVATINGPILERFMLTVDNERTVEIRSAEGKALVEKYSITQAPAFIMSKEAAEAEQLVAVWPQVGSIESDGVFIFRRSDSLEMIYEELQSDGTWKLKGGIETSDRPKMELFVMSMCPYGVQAEQGVKPVYDLMKDSADFEVYFISTDNGDGTFRSLHGQPETDENIRQTCIIEHAPDKYWDYLECLNPEYRSAGTKWEECTAEVGIDTETIRTCFEGDEGKTLLSESIQRTMEVGATGSPTILVNGAGYRGGRSPEEFKMGMCVSFNNPPEVCDEILSTEGAAAQGNC